ncbi:putative nucleotidyltransferase substrate binding domain-containing protein [Alsobacter sp. R-9]
MPKAFDAANPPFDRLDPAEADMLREGMDIGYWRPGETIQAQGAAAEGLYVVIKGTVEEREDDELVALLGPKDSFDGRAVVQGRSAHAFMAREETLAYIIPRGLVLAAIERNPRFASFFFLEISRKLEAVARDEEDQRVGTLMRARVRDVFLQPAVFIDASDSIEKAGHTMRDVNTNALFVTDGPRTGIVTGMNLSKGAVLQRLPLETPVGRLAHYDVATVAPDDFVSSALLMMTKHNKRRLAVHDGESYVGIIEDIDLLGFIAGNTQLVAGRIDRAGSLDDLAAAAREIEGQVRLLRRQGVKVEVIAEIVSDLNRRLFAKLFALLAPPSVRRDACLIVMGSEGRGEQTVRTDQDNGLVLRQPIPAEDLDQFRAAFSEALASFGFPPCPGGVMVSNPAWCRTLADWQAELRRWIALPDEAAHMNMAILFDSQAVAGDASLLDTLRADLMAAASGEQAYLAHFARAVDAFPSPIGLFNTLITAEGKGDSLDLKKGGIFPVVHGARALALEKRIEETSTAGRIGRLADLGVLRREDARELVQAFHFLSGLRLDAQLSHDGGKSGTLVRPSALSSMERDLLRDAFVVVKQFRAVVSRHFGHGLF